MKRVAGFLAFLVLVAAVVFLFVLKDEDSFEVEYLQGGVATSREDQALLRVSFGASSAALVQSIIATNAVLFTDPTRTPHPTFLERLDDANHALGLLADLAEQTEEYANRLGPSTTLARVNQGRPDNAVRAMGLPLLPLFQSRPSKTIDPKEVEAVLNAGDPRRPIATLMRAYGVNARRAQAILNTAMAGIESSAYTDEADFHDRALRAANAIKDTSALAVTIGTTYLSAGSASAAVTKLSNDPLALVSGIDAILKFTKSGIELALGEQNAVSESSAVQSTIFVTSAVSEFAALKSLGEVGAGLGKMWTAFQDKTITTSQALQKVTEMGAELGSDKGARLYDLIYVSSKTTEAVFSGEIKFGETQLVVYPGAWEWLDWLKAETHEEWEPVVKRIAEKGRTLPPAAKSTARTLPRGSYDLTAAGEPGARLQSDGLDAGFADLIADWLPLGLVIDSLQSDVLVARALGFPGRTVVHYSGGWSESNAAGSTSFRVNLLGGTFRCEVAGSGSESRGSATATGTITASEDSCHGSYDLASGAVVGSVTAVRAATITFADAPEQDQNITDTTTARISGTIDPLSGGYGTFDSGDGDPASWYVGRD
ncbi:MAG: hypothetical protein HY534_03880 [Chloroflexi bacterium]|nr:hypothetical protein [Chloroflexota bacterium]